MRPLITCENNFEAQLIIGRLENEGIKAVILNEHIHNILPYFNTQPDAFTVHVRDEDYTIALQIIGEDIAKDL